MQYNRYRYHCDAAAAVSTLASLSCNTETGPDGAAYDMTD